MGAARDRILTANKAVLQASHLSGPGVSKHSLVEDSIGQGTAGPVPQGHGSSVNLNKY